MQKILSYKDLLVWQKSIDITTEVYRVAKMFPPEERFGLASQMQRAAVSVAANIAEGHGRGTRNDYAHFLDMAHGSLAELETLFVIVRKLSYCPSDQCSKIDEQLHEVGKMLGSLRSKLRSRP
jgi:four helix bundle protein